MRRQNSAGAKWNGNRDRRLLHALGRAVLLTVAQVRLVGNFGSREAAARRMRKLAKLGYVRIWKPKDKTMHDRYGITVAGRERLLQEDAEIFSARVHVAQGIGRRDLDHLARLADVRIALGSACDSRDDLALGEYLGEADLRALAEEGGACLLPDALLIIETVSEPVSQLGVWIELDQGTTGVRQFAIKKLEPLGSHLAAGYPVLGVTKWIVLVLVESQARADAIARLAAGSFIPGSLWLAALAAFLADPLGRVLWPARADAALPASLTELLFQRRVPAAGTAADEDCDKNLGA